MIRSGSTVSGVDNLPPEFFERQNISFLKKNLGDYDKLDSLGVFAAKCCIWGTPSGAANLFNEEENNTRYVLFYSPRAGGWYIAEENIAEEDYLGMASHLKENWVTYKKIPKNVLTTWLIERRKQTIAPVIRARDLEIMKSLNKKTMNEKIKNTLEFLSKNYNAGEHVRIYIGNDRFSIEGYIIKSQEMLLAHSESIDFNEFFEILDCMKRDRLIKFFEGDYDLKYFKVIPTHEAIGNEYAVIGGVIILTGEGKRTAEKNEQGGKRATNKNILSKKVFIAMWIDDKMKPFLKSLKKGIENAGYHPFAINEHHHNKKIDAEIIKQIEASKFIIVDSTHGGTGARGSVYYEAGYAHGIKKEVIFTCREDMIEKVHFDTRQYFHITWDKDKLEEFSKEIENHIKATITD